MKVMNMLVSDVVDFGFLVDSGPLIKTSPPCKKIIGLPRIIEFRKRKPAPSDYNPGNHEVLPEPYETHIKLT